MPETTGTSAAVPFTRIAVMGTGAVGGYFGGMLARAGLDVTFIARPATADFITRKGLRIDSANFHEALRVKATADLAAVKDAELILFCVKTLDTDSVAASLKPFVKSKAIVVSLQNGVDNADRIRAAGLDGFPAVVYVAASVPERGRIKHDARGDLAIGGEANRLADLQRIAATFTQAGVPCEISQNIDTALWSKFVFNCALNAISAIAQVGYGTVGTEQWGRECAIAAAKETIAVGRAVGVQLPEDEIIAKLIAFAQKMGEVRSSTAQDIAKGKRTEADDLNGYVVRRGAEFGVPTPVNHTLTALLKLIETRL